MKEKATPKVYVTFSITTSDYEKLATAAEKADCPIAKLVRNIIIKEIKNNGRI